MSLTTINLTGAVLPPDSQYIGGTMIFALSGAGVDAEGGLVAPREVVTPILAGGNFDVDLWPNSRGTYPTSYAVYLEMQPARPGCDPIKVKIGTLSLQGFPENQLLHDVLVTGHFPVASADVLAAAIAAKVAATAAAAQAVAAAAQAVAFGSIYTQTDAQLLSVTIPADVDVVQRMPSVTGQVAPPNIISRWRRNASPGAEDFWTDATGATFTVAEITQAEILSTLTSALDAAFTDPAFSGSANFANGTAAAPSMRFSSDPDTGVYRNGTNSIGFAAGGTRRAFLSSTAMQVDVPITGTAVVSSDSDVTAGRLLKTVAGPAQAFRRGNILGTVSQAGGVPTGAVIQRGSNANGEFVRFADGTQICTFTPATGVACATTKGALFGNAATQTWTFPIAFADEPAVSGSGGGANRWLTLSPPTTTTVGWETLSHTPSATESAPTLTAIGRWF